MGRMGGTAHDSGIRDWRRPKYTYESGRIQYGELETNGDFFVTKRRDRNLAFTIGNLTRAVYNNQILFDQLPGFFGLSFDGSSDEKGVGKARYWRDTIRLR